MNLRIDRRQTALWLNALLGLALLLVAGLDVALLGGIGWAAWQRATLSEKWLRMREDDRLQLSGDQREVRELRSFVATAQGNVAAILQTFPTDADVARYLASLRAAAVAQGVLITDLSPQAGEPGAPLARRFAVRLEGSWLRLVGFLTEVAQTSLSTARLEDVALYEEGGQAELSFELVVVTRAAGPPVSESHPDSRATALATDSGHEEQEARWQVRWQP